jgi:hypothetical protein
MSKIVNCQDYIASLIDEQRSMEHWQNDTDGGELKYSEKNLSHACEVLHGTDTSCVATGFSKLPYIKSSPSLVVLSSPRVTKFSFSKAIT